MERATRSLLKNFSMSFRIILVTIVVFVLQVIFKEPFTQQLMLTKGSLFTAPYTLFTSLFLHSSPDHLFFNMFGLLIFGPLLELQIGSRRFLFIYLFSGLIASAIGSFIYPAALGASAALMGIIGATIFLLPSLKVLFFFVIPMPLWMAGIIWAAIDVFGIFVPNGVGNFAHLIGLACGLLYGVYIKQLKKAPASFTAQSATVVSQKERQSSGVAPRFSFSFDSIQPGSSKERASPTHPSARKVKEITPEDLENFYKNGRI